MNLELFTTASIQHFNSLDTSYKEVITKHLNEIKITSDLNKKIKIFDKFVDEYTVIPELWMFGYQLKNCENHFEDKLCFLKKSFSHFYSNKVFTFVTNCNYGIEDLIPFQKTYAWLLYSFLGPIYKDSIYHGDLEKKEKISQYIEEGFTFPHGKLKDLYDLYTEYSDRPLLKNYLDQFQKALLQAPKCNIENFRSNYAKWIENLFEISDKFAIQNIEYYLALNYHDKNLWKSYIISMQKRRNMEITSHILHRYIKLFIDDFEIKENFKDILKMKINNNSFMDNYLFDKKLLATTGTTTTNIFKTHSQIKNNIKKQTFCFSSPLINYFIDSAADYNNVQQKLLKTCKYFIMKFKSKICHHLRITTFANSSQYYQESLKINFKDINEFNLSNLHITNCLAFNVYYDETILQKLIPKFYKCDARFIDICHQTLLWKEFLFLINPKKLEKFHLAKCTVFKEKNKIIATPVEIISLIPFTPSISLFKYSSQPISLETIEIITNLKRMVKFQRCKLYPIDLSVTIQAYCNFLKAQAALKSYFSIGWTNISYDDKKIFESSIKTFINENYPQDAKPTLSTM